MYIYDTIQYTFTKTVTNHYHKISSPFFISFFFHSIPCHTSFLPSVSKMFLSLCRLPPSLTPSIRFLVFLFVISFVPLFAFFIHFSLSVDLMTSDLASEFDWIWWRPIELTSPPDTQPSQKDRGNGEEDAGPRYLRLSGRDNPIGWRLVSKKPMTFSAEKNSNGFPCFYGSFLTAAQWRRLKMRIRKKWSVMSKHTFLGSGFVPNKLSLYWNEM